MIGTCTVYTSYEAALLKFVAWQLHSSKFLLTACRIRIHVSHLAKCYLPIQTKSISDSNQWFERKNKAEKKHFLLPVTFVFFYASIAWICVLTWGKGPRSSPPLALGTGLWTAELRGEAVPLSWFSICWCMAWKDNLQIKKIVTGKFYS